VRDMLHPRPQAPHAKPQWQLEGRHVLATFLAFFAVVFAVNGYMLVSALRTHSGVVSVEPYRKGLAYNDRIADGERQTAMGWNDTASLDAAGHVAVRMMAKDGTPLIGLRLSAVLGRPVTERGDMPLTFTEVAPGDYRARVGPLDAGTWQIVLEAFHETDRTHLYRAKRRLWLKS
jgi:nitrogen fixation protein FixH